MIQGQFNPKDLQQFTFTFRTIIQTINPYHTHSLNQMNIQKQLQSIQREGNLKKQSRFLKTWRDRWFVLTPHLLLTYKERRVYKNPTQSIQLKDIQSIKSADEESANHCFKIQTSQLVFIISAETSVEKEQWIGAIGKAMVKSNSTYKD